MSGSVVLRSQPSGADAFNDPRNGIRTSVFSVTQEFVCLRCAAFHYPGIAKQNSRTNDRATLAFTIKVFTDTLVARPIKKNSHLHSITQIVGHMNCHRRFIC